MKKSLILSLFALALVLALGSCKQAADGSIVGTWSLATIQGAPVSLVPNTSGTLVVANDMTFTQNLDVNGTAGTSTGVVTNNGNNSFTFKYTGDVFTPNGYAATMSSDGKTLTIENLVVFGTLTWTK